MALTLHLGQFGDGLLPTGALQGAAERSADHVPHDRVKPGLEWTRRLAGVTGLEDRDQGFLANVLSFGLIGDAAPHKARDRWSDLIEEGPERLLVAILDALHELHPTPALLRVVYGHHKSNCGKPRQKLLRADSRVNSLRDSHASIKYAYRVTSASVMVAASRVGAAP